MEQAVRLEDERARLMIENDYYAYLDDYLSKENQSDQVIAPSTMGISDPMIITLVGQLAELQAEYYSLGAGGKNPLQVNLSVRIQNTRRALLETLKGIIRSNDYAINENQTRLRELNRQAESLPVTERKLLGIEREFKLNDALYNFLLQKQAEAQIQKASNTYDTKVIDPPRLLPGKIRPRSEINYFVAVLLGLFLPVLFLIFFDLLKTKINSENDIKGITNIPIIGHIPHNKKTFQKIMLDDPSSDVAEAFRALRSRLQYFTKGKKAPIILLTSSIPGEGKTFAAINLASAYSLKKMKTILVGVDLRKPRIFADFGLSNSLGLSSYLIGQKTVKDIIQPSGYPYLDIILSGPVPPNPAELIDTEEMKDLITLLKDEYDYIILDSSPIGIVSDSYVLAENCDVCIVLIRHRKTMKQLFANTLENINTNNISGLTLLVNDLGRSKQEL